MLNNPDDPPKKGILRPGDYLEVLDEYEFLFTTFARTKHGEGVKQIITMREGDTVQYLGPITAGQRTLYRFVYIPYDKDETKLFYVENPRHLLKGIGY